MSGSYLVSLEDPADSVGHLVCFHHAGGAARLFAQWPESFEGAITVTGIELPGRGRRFGEEMPGSLEAVADEVCDELPADYFEARPPVLFGHSMGAALAFEVGLRLQREGWEPERIVVSGAAPVDDRGVPRHELSDDELTRELREFGGTPPEVLEKPELMELYLPVIRSDLRLVEEYSFGGKPALDTPLTAVRGRSDPNVDSDGLRRWQEYTDRDFETEEFPGGHFFLQNYRQQLLDWLESHLRETGAIAR